MPYISFFISSHSEKEAWRKWARSSVAAVAIYYLVGAILVTLGHGEILTNNPWLDSLVRLIGEGFPVVIHGELGIRPSEDMMLWRAVMNPGSIICAAYVSMTFPAGVTAKTLQDLGSPKLLSRHSAKRLASIICMLFFAIILIGFLFNGAYLDSSKWVGVVRAMPLGGVYLILIGGTWNLILNMFWVIAVISIKVFILEYSKR